MLHAYGVRGETRELIASTTITNNTESAKSIGRYQKFNYSEKNQYCPVISSVTLDGQNQSQKSQIQLGKSPGNSLKISHKAKGKKLPESVTEQRYTSLKASKASNHMYFMYSPQDSVKKG